MPEVAFTDEDTFSFLRCDFFSGMDSMSGIHRPNGRSLGDWGCEVWSFARRKASQSCGCWIMPEVALQTRIFSYSRCHFSPGTNGWPSVYTGGTEVEKKDRCLEFTGRLEGVTEIGDVRCGILPGGRRHRAVELDHARGGDTDEDTFLFSGMDRCLEFTGRTEGVVEIEIGAQNHRGPTDEEERGRASLRAHSTFSRWKASQS